MERLRFNIQAITERLPLMSPQFEAALHLWIEFVYLCWQDETRRADLDWQLRCARAQVTPPIPDDVWRQAERVAQRFVTPPVRSANLREWYYSYGEHYLR